MHSGESRLGILRTPVLQYFRGFPPCGTRPKGGVHVEPLRKYAPGFGTLLQLDIETLQIRTRNASVYIMMHKRFEI
jgi:hypothetical protein